MSMPTYLGTYFDTPSGERLTPQKGESSMWNNTLGLLRPRLVGALAVCMLVMMGGTASTVAVYDTAAFSQHRITATTLATEQLESMKALGFHKLGSTHTIWHEDYNTMTDVPTFRRQTVVAPCTPDMGMKTVTVTVSWDGNVNAVRMSLILAE